MSTEATVPVLTFTTVVPPMFTISIMLPWALDDTAALRLEGGLLVLSGRALRGLRGLTTAQLRKLSSASTHTKFPSASTLRVRRRRPGPSTCAVIPAEGPPR